MNFFLTLFFLAPLSRAYIPEYSLIASRTADLHGRGSYLIEQDVTSHKDGETYTVHETWSVDGENLARVTLEGQGPLKGLVHGSIIYDGKRKIFVDSSGPARAQRLGDDWLEPLFTFHSSKFFRARLVSLKVAPEESLRDRPPMPSDSDPKYVPPSFIHLSRVGGAVAWAIGSAVSNPNHPMIWIEQDQFVIRKFRGADQILVRADDYAKTEDGFWYPRHRVYTFGKNSEVDVDITRVKPLGRLPAKDMRFRAASLTGAHDDLKPPEADALREFYSRFR